MNKFKTYGVDEIQKVYRRHHSAQGSVIYSDDAGANWKIAEADTGKWNIRNWLFAFVEVTAPVRRISELERSKGRSENFYSLSIEEQWAEDKRLGILDWDGK